MPVNVTHYSRLCGRAVLAGRERTFDLDVDSGHLVLGISDIADARAIMDALKSGMVAHTMAADDLAPEREPSQPAHPGGPKDEAPPVPRRLDLPDPEVGRRLAGLDKDAVVAGVPAAPPAAANAPAEAAPPPPQQPTNVTPIKPPLPPLTAEDLPPEVTRAVGVHHLVTWLWNKRGVRSADEALAEIEQLRAQDVDLGCVRRAGDQLAARVRAAVQVLEASEGGTR